MGELRALLDAGVDVNATDEVELTALHLAAREGHVRAVHMLIEAGADVHARTTALSTSLHSAVFAYGQSEASVLVTVERLVDAGADVNAKDNRGRTVLHLAVKNAQPDVVSFLLSLRELDVLAVNEHDKTAFGVCDDMISSRVDGDGERIEEEQLARLPSVREKLVDRIVKANEAEAKSKLYALALGSVFTIELGPLLTALLLAGRIGGSYAAGTRPPCHRRVTRPEPGSRGQTLFELSSIAPGSILEESQPKSRGSWETFVSM